MCREDLRLGRRKYTTVTRTLCPIGTETRLVDASKKRTHLSFGAFENGAAVTPLSQDGFGNTGFIVNSTNGKLDFDVEKHGDVVTFAWTGFAPLIDTIVTVIETFFDDGVYP